MSNADPDEKLVEKSLASVGAITNIAEAIALLMKQSPMEVEALKKELRKQGITGLQRPGGTRPKGTYYSNHYAQLLKPFIDSMVVNSKIELFFALKKFPKLTLATLHQLIYQAFTYLRECPDTSEVDRKAYNELWDNVTIVKSKVPLNEGIYIKWLANVHGHFTDLQGEVVDVQKNIRGWKEQLATWLDVPDAKHPNLSINNLHLEPDEVDDLDTQLNSLPGIMARITTNTIKVVRTS